MQLKDERLNEIIACYIKHGEMMVSQRYNLGIESLNRYIREYKIRNGNLPNEAESPNITLPKVLVLDIETAPLLGFVWSLWKQNVALNQIAQDWFILTWSAKWLMDAEVFCGKITPEEVKVQDDSRIVKDIYSFINAADVVIAHNGDNFDLAKLNARFLIQGLDPPLPYQSIDTLKIAKKKFAFTSNKLDYIAGALGLGHKLDTGGFELWKSVLQGDQEAIDKMAIYNQRDVTLLEEVYLKMRPWAPSHPNMGLYMETTKSVCAACGSTNLRSEGKYSTMVGSYSTYRCLDCGGISRARVSVLDKEKRNSLIVSVAR
jgi:DNA polymerase elongation subunit (family B)